MTAQQFRRLALSLPKVAESSHQAHPDFRFRDKIFATLGYPDARCGMVKLTAEQQAAVIRRLPAVFQPAVGALGPTWQHCRFALFDYGGGAAPNPAPGLR